MIKIYGLKSCDTCKKAIRALKDAEKSFEFIDIRSDVDLDAKLPEWMEAVETSALVNTRSSTWRSLSEEDKAKRDNGQLTALLKAYPALIKRPLIEAEGNIHVGWTKEVEFSIGL